VKLRNVEVGDLDLYYRMRCDPVMMTELGGPLPREGMADKVTRDVARTEADLWWVLTILADDDDPASACGGISLWSDPDDGERRSEIGWMVVPEYQGRGLAKAATRAVLERAGRDGRWGMIHATPAVTNGPSNGICRSLGFTLLGEADVVFAGQMFRCNDWQIDPVADLPSAPGEFHHRNADHDDGAGRHPEPPEPLMKEDGADQRRDHDAGLT
jgi:RimJ/RimL family protein N-acetyltransferase